MNAYSIDIENLFQQKVLLYKDLLEIIKQEKNSVIGVKVDSLWDLSSKKQTITSKIEKLRKQILVILSDNGHEHGQTVSCFNILDLIVFIDKNVAHKILKLNLDLKRLKIDIHSRINENKKFIKESLKTIGDLVNVIASSGQVNYSYSQNKSYDLAKSKNFLFNRTV